MSSDFASDEHAADYYRQVLYTTLLAGGRGWLAWNNCDYDDLRDQDPYRHHVFEMHFGLTDRHGRPKPQLRVLGEFAQLVEELSASGWERVAGDAAIVVPEHFERILPFTEDAYRRDIRDNLLQAYVAAREADLPVELVRERDGIPGTPVSTSLRAKLLTAPGLAAACASSRRRRDRLPLVLRGQHRQPARALADVARRDLRRPPCPALRTRRPDRGGRGDVRVRRRPRRHRRRHETRLRRRRRAQRALLPAGRACRRRGRGGRRAGRPALLRHALGSGATVLCTYPIEHFAARTPRANPESTWRLYSALAEAAGVSRPVRVDDPRVLVGRIDVPGSERVLFVNTSSERVPVEPIVAGGVHLDSGAGGCGARAAASRSRALRRRARPRRESLRGNPQRDSGRLPDSAGPKCSWHSHRILRARPRRRELGREGCAVASRPSSEL